LDKALCYEDIRLWIVQNPRPRERDLVAMEITLKYHQGADAKAVQLAHHPVASVSGALRMIYLSLPYPTTAKHKATTPIHLNIGEALYFNDFRTLVAFFRKVLVKTLLFYIK
jgi:hypothetical protein